MKSLANPRVEKSLPLPAPHLSYVLFSPLKRFFDPDIFFSRCVFFVCFFVSLALLPPRPGLSTSRSNARSSYPINGSSAPTKFTCPSITPLPTLTGHPSTPLSNESRYPCLSARNCSRPVSGGMRPAEAGARLRSRSAKKKRKNA